MKVIQLLSITSGSGVGTPATPVDALDASAPFLYGDIPAVLAIPRLAQLCAPSMPRRNVEFLLGIVNPQAPRSNQSVVKCVDKLLAQMPRRPPDEHRATEVVVPASIPRDVDAYDASMTPW